MSNYCFYNSQAVLTGNDRLENSAVLVKDGKIFDVITNERVKEKVNTREYELIDVKKGYITPGFVDNHIHGFAGYGTDGDRGADDILNMSLELAKYGVTSFVPTLYPRPVSQMKEIIKNCSQAMGREKGAKIIGLHLEGPFFSKDKKGVHNESYLIEPSIDVMKEFIEAAGGIKEFNRNKKLTNIATMTVAPELKGMRELAIFCIEHGITLQAGHTVAEYKHMIEAFQVGIVHMTHFFNAMSALDHRDPRAVGAALIHGDVSCEIIADGAHVHPKLVYSLYKLKDISKIVLVTDGLTPTKQKRGKLLANKDEVYLAEDGLFHRLEDNVIAGSALTMHKGVKNLVKFGYSLSSAIQAATYNPIKVLGLDGRGLLTHGYAADINVLDQNLNLKLTMIDSKIIFNKI